MKKILLLVLIVIAGLFIVLPKTDAAISFDASSSVTSASNATSVTIAHTIGGGSNTMLFVLSLTTNNVATETYNGVTMNLVGTQLEANDSRWLSLYYLANPAAGTHNIVIQTATSSVLLRGAGSSYAGVNPTLNGSSTAHIDSAVAFFTSTVVTTVDNDWGVLAARQTGGTNPGGIKAGTSTVFRSSDTFDAIGDTNGVITPPQTASMTVTGTATGTGGFYTTMAAMAPATQPAVTAVDFSVRGKLTVRGPLTIK